MHITRHLSSPFDDVMSVVDILKLLVRSETILISDYFHDVFISQNKVLQCTPRGRHSDMFIHSQWL